MSKYKGQIADFPEEIVEKMLERQEEQYGKRDVTVFKENKTAGLKSKGFDWDKTKERSDFWYNVLYEENFDIFFKKYPKKRKFKVGDKVKITRLPKAGEKKWGLSLQSYRELLGKEGIITKIHNSEVFEYNISPYTLPINLLEKVKEEETHNFKVGDKVVVHKLPDDTNDNRYMINLSMGTFNTFIGKEYTIDTLYEEDEDYVARAELENSLHLPLCSLKKVEEESVKETVETAVKTEVDKAIEKHYMVDLDPIKEDFKVGDTVQLYKVPNSNSNEVLVNLPKDWYKKNKGEIGKITRIVQAGISGDKNYYIKRARVDSFHYYIPLCALRKVSVGRKGLHNYASDGILASEIFKGKSEQKLPEIKIRNKKRIRIKL